MPRSTFLPTLASGLGLQFLIVLMLIVAGTQEGGLSPLFAIAALLTAAAVAWLTIRSLRHLERIRLAQTQASGFLVEAISDAVLHFDADGRVVYLNPAARTLLAADPDSLNRSRLRIIDRQTRAPLSECILDEARTGRIASLPPGTRLINAAGLEIDIEGRCQPLRGEHGEILGAVLCLRDITELRESMRQKCPHEQQDPLTSLPNRSVIEERLAKALLGNRAAENPMSYLHIDLLDIDAIATDAGPAARDEALCQYARLMHSRLRESDLLARIDRQSFAILLKSCPDSIAGRIADNLRDSIAACPFIWDGCSYPMHANLGAVHIASNASAADDYMQRAQALASENRQETLP